jgi:hypothetical protein
MEIFMKKVKKSVQNLLIKYRKLAKINPKQADLLLDKHQYNNELFKELKPAELRRWIARKIKVIEAYEI